MSSEHSNLELCEFRKIPSLQYLYEINANGTILRNAKSKHKCKMGLDYSHNRNGQWVAYVVVKDTLRKCLVSELVAESWIGPKKENFHLLHIDNDIHNNDYRNLKYVYSDGTSPSIGCRVDGKEFPSLASAAKWIEAQTGGNIRSIKSRFKQRRSNILGYEVEYLGAKVSSNAVPYDSRSAETRHIHPTG